MKFTMGDLSVRRSQVRWLVEWAPVVALFACLWLKLVYSSGLFGDAAAWMDARVKEDRVVYSAALATTALLVSPLCLMRRVPRLLFVSGVSFAISLILLADTVYFRRFLDIITVASVFGAGQLQQHETVAAAISLLRSGDLLYFLDVSLALLSIPFYLVASRHRPEADRRSRRRAASCFLTIGVLACLPVGRLVWDPALWANADMFRGELVSIIGVVPYHAFDVVNHLVPAARKADDATLTRVRQFLDRHRQQGPSRLFGVASGKNLILLQAESLSAFPVGLTVGGQAVAPNLSAFAAESLNFTAFFDQTHGGGTSDAEFTALTSLHPLPEGAVPFRVPNNHFRALPRILSEVGYATLSATTVASRSYAREVMHPSYGFQASFFERDFEDRERLLWITDRELFRQMVPRLGAQKSPFMALLISSSNHDPYSIPAKKGPLRLTAALEGSVLGDYLRSVSYFDQVFGEFLTDLRTAGLLDTSVIALYGDHTGIFDFPPELPALLGFPADRAYDWRVALTRLPFLIRLPQGQAAEVHGDAGGHLDIAPTLLSLLGVDDGDRVMLGRDLTRPGESIVVFRDGSFATADHLFVNRPFARRVACYRTGSPKAIDCSQLEAQHTDALEHLRISDTILRHDVVPDLVRSKPPLTFQDLPPPEAVSEFGAAPIRIDGLDLHAHPPSRATFDVPGRGKLARVMFAPGLVPEARGKPTDGVTFEVWAGGQRLYQRHAMPGENLDPAVVEVPPAPNRESARISFVTTPGPRGDRYFDWALWRGVQFFVGDSPHTSGHVNLATRRSLEPQYSFGFYDQERGPAGSTWRWMGSEARIVLRNTNRDMQLRLDGSILPQLAQPPTITLEFNGQRLDQLVNVRGVVQRRYDISPAMQSDGDSSTLRLTSSRTFSPKEVDPQSPDERRLSFVVNDVSWGPR